MRRTKSALAAAAIVSLALLSVQEGSAQAGCAATCRGGAAAATASATDTELTEADLGKAADYVLEQGESGLQVTNAGGYITIETVAGTALTPELIRSETGVAITDADMEALLGVLMTRKEAEGAQTQYASGPGCATGAGSTACTTANLCGEFAACSWYGDLAAASGDKREQYFKEKGEDGRRYEDLVLPAFEARDVEGNHVSSASLEGTPTLLVLMAPHCGHSIRTLSTLKRLDRRYEPKGVNVVGVFVNTRSLGSAKSKAKQYEIEYPLWTYSDDALGKALGTHLAPTALLVSADGHVLQKFVGEKAEKELAAGMDALLAGDGVKLGMLTE